MPVFILCLEGQAYLNDCLYIKAVITAQKYLKGSKVFLALKDVISLND